MKFYALDFMEDDDQEGSSIEGFREGYDTNSVNSATRIRYYKKIDFNPDLDFMLGDDGKATDLLRPPYIGSDRMLVSPRFYEILKAGKLIDHQCFNAVVRDGSKLLPYYFMHFYFRFDSDENDLVDFSKTSFVARKVIGPISILALPADEEGVLGEFQVSSWDEFHLMRDKRENDRWHKFIVPKEKLYIRQREFLDLDLFCMTFGNYNLSHFVVSERLAGIISESGLTGLGLSPLDYEIVSN